MVKEKATIYFDNAATTPMLPEVVDVVANSMLSNFGNPSSVHQFGRAAKSSIELVRKNIAKHFNVSSSQIVFTSGGTEADNLILYNAVLNLGVKTIITSKIEHHAVLHTVKKLQELFSVKVCFVVLNKFGEVDLDDLERLLSLDDSKKMVSLMMINNEVGNVLPMDSVCVLCNQYNALFHSDTTQAIGYYEMDLQDLPVDFIVASAHKFHGPKGVGFLYFKKGLLLKSLIEGGGQEKGLRSGTESVHSILGMGKALDLAYRDVEKSKLYILELKEYLKRGLKELYPNVSFNGMSSDLEQSDFKILNVRFPFSDSMFLFYMDMNGVASSSGSACQSGSVKVSYVLKEILDDSQLLFTSIRFSFSKMNTIDEIDFLLDFLSKNKK